jgi:hypothetical protein
VAYAEVVCGLCVAVISLEDNCIGDEGAAAIGAGLHGLPSLTSLKYVMQAWVMCMMGRGQAEWCDGKCCTSWCGAARPVSGCVMCGKGGVVRGMEGGMGDRLGEDVTGMVYDVGMWSCVGRCGQVWVYVHVGCGSEAVKWEMMCVVGCGMCGCLVVCGGWNGVCRWRVGVVWYGEDACVVSNCCACVCSGRGQGL